MSTKTEITRLQSAKSSIKMAIEGKGVTVPDSTKLDGMAALIGSIPSGGGLSGETWVLNEYISPSSQEEVYSTDFTSNNRPFNSIRYTDSTSAILYYNDIVVYGGRPEVVWKNQAYRKVTFSAPPSGNLLTWLETNAVKQDTDLAVQPSKGISIATNGVTNVFPDVPYDAIKKVVATVNVAGAFPNGTEWTQSDVDPDIYVTSVANANGLWVAGSNNSGLYYSVDGKTWTQSDTTDIDVTSVANANGLWVAGSGSGPYYSVDGKTWTQNDSANADVFISVANANGLWVAIGIDNSGLYYSVDGKTWTQSNIIDVGFASVANANGLWVAGGDPEGLFYSVDGKTWARSNITAGEFTSVANANGIWVAACSGGPNENGLYYSVDGKTWTQSSITGEFTSVANANGLWVAGSNNSGLYYSVDGKTWTQSDIVDGESLWLVHNANGLWVAANSNYEVGGNGLYYSVDGKTWTQSNVINGGFILVANANGIWVASSDNGLYYSVSWEPS